MRQLTSFISTRRARIAIGAGLASGALLYYALRRRRKRPRLPPGPVDTGAYAAALAAKAEVRARYNAYMAEHKRRRKGLYAEVSEAERLVGLYETRIKEQEEHEAWLAKIAEEAAKAKLDEEKAAAAKVRRGASQHEQLSYALRIVKLDIDGETLEFPEDLEWAEKALRDGGITSVLTVRDAIDSVGGTCECGYKVRDEYCQCKNSDCKKYEKYVDNPGYFPAPEFDHLGFDDSGLREARGLEMEAVIYGHQGRKGLYEALKLSQQQIDASSRREA